MNATATADYIDVDPTQIELLYQGSDGSAYTQPLSDIPESGTLIDPETGEDLELISTRVSTAAPGIAAPAHEMVVQFGAKTHPFGRVTIPVSEDDRHVVLQALYQQLAQTTHYRTLIAAHRGGPQLRLAENESRVRALISVFEQAPHAHVPSARRVSWIIDIDNAASPAHAALEVWQNHFGRTGQPASDECCVFSVLDPKSGLEVTIDLSDEAHEPLFT